ncbi:hypothetical protein E4T56_gene6127, partial [Termitomyces sp. T112]
MLLCSVLFLLLLHVLYPREFQWMLMLPASGPPLPCCVDTVKRLATLPVIVLKAHDAAGTPSPDALTTVSPTEVVTLYTARQTPAPPAPPPPSPPPPTTPPPTPHPPHHQPHPPTNPSPYLTTPP